MACRLFGAKQLSNPMLPYCQLDTKEHISVKLLFRIQQFSFKEMHLKMPSAKMAAILPDLNVLTFPPVLQSKWHAGTTILDEVIVCLLQQT